MDEIAIKTRVAENFPQAIADLKELVAIESISSLPSHELQMQQSANWIAARTRELGLDTQIIQLQTSENGTGRPAILATRPAQPGKRTVLLYAHHDVQPTGELALWDTAPFEAQVVGDRIYGRGTADDKAGVILHLAAIAAAEPGAGIVLFIEGEEEVGSPTFVDFLHTYQEELAADLIVVADSNNWEVGSPSLTTSLRGVATLEVELRVLDHALHSGMYGGPILDSVTLAARLIATLHDDAGDVAVAGLAGSDNTDVDYAEAQLRADAGVLPGVELAGTGSLTSRLWTKPAISVIAMDTTTVAQASNTISPTTKFVLSLRVSPAQDTKVAAEALRAHLLANAPFGAEVTVNIVETGPGFTAGADTELTNLGRAALAAAWGKEPVDIGVGGSIPFISDLAEVFPAASILVTGVEDPDTRAHSANESLHLGDWQNAIVAEALLLSELAN
ncbi:MAG: M20/M25/M40 family metallo-hydrolase [Trueperella sp.]|nr:M20/M25/M40 family metallo-hydrolase [Trueperella sp.]